MCAAWSCGSRFPSRLGRKEALSLQCLCNMNNNHGFGHTLLHKTQQGSPLRTSSHRYHSDVLQLDCEIKRLLDSPERRPIYSAIVKERGAGKEGGARVTTTRSTRRWGASRGRDGGKTTARTASTEPISPGKGGRVKPFLARSQSQEVVGTRAAQLLSLKSRCSQFQSQISKDLRKVTSVQSVTLRHLRRCHLQLHKALLQELPVPLPHALLELKRRNAAKRARSESPRIDDRPMSMKKEVIEEYHRAAFQKACKNGLSLRMRYVATLGTTRATHLMQAVAEITK